MTDADVANGTQPDPSRELRAAERVLAGFSLRPSRFHRCDETFGVPPTRAGRPCALPGPTIRVPVNAYAVRGEQLDQLPRPPAGTRWCPRCLFAAPFAAYHAGGHRLCDVCRYEAQLRADELRGRVRDRTRPCDVCGALFTPPRRDGRYCSHACRQRSYRRRAGAR